MIYNKTILAQLNKKIVIDMIRTQGPINKAEIARKAGLSIPTVMKITDDFERQKLIRNIGKGESTGGKRPDLLEFVFDAYYIVGIDIGRHNVKILIMDMAAHILVKECFATHKEELENPERFLAQVADWTSTFMEESGIEPGRFMGIGIGMPGILDYESGTVLVSPDFSWENIRIKEIFERKFPYKIILENTNKALAMGEYTYGAAKDCKSFFCINWGYGIGAAVMEDGRILYGKNGAAGEFGHTIVKKNGPVCDCGHKGCLEAVSSGNAMAKCMKQKLGQGEESLLAEVFLDGEGLDSKKIFDAARTGDRLSSQIIGEAVEYLGISIAGVINLLDPEVIVLAGGITKGKDLYEDFLMKAISTYKMKYSGRNVRIQFSKLGEYGTAIGVGAMFLNDFLENGGMH